MSFVSSQELGQEKYKNPPHLPGDLRNGECSFAHMLFPVGLKMATFWFPTFDFYLVTKDAFINQEINGAGPEISLQC